MAEATEELDLIWGLESIAKLIGRTVRQTHYLLKTGKLPAKRVGERWVASRSQLSAFFMDTAA